MLRTIISFPAALLITAFFALPAQADLIIKNASGDRVELIMECGNMIHECSGGLGFVKIIGGDELEGGQSCSLEVNGQDTGLTLFDGQEYHITKTGVEMVQ